jgi:hypothetical protein
MIGVKEKKIANGSAKQIFLRQNKKAKGFYEV